MTLTLNIGGPIGWTGSFTADRNHTLYISYVGVNYGRATPVCLSASADYLLQGTVPQPNVITGFLSNLGFTAGGGDWIGGQLHWTPGATPTDRAIEFGFFTPQVGATASWTEVWDPRQGFPWPPSFLPR